MNSDSLRVKFWLIGLGLVVLTGGIIVYGWHALQSPQAIRTNTNTSNAARERYAELYETAFRADEGRGSVLMTATLLLPPAITALGQDTTRSDIEDSLYRIVRNLPDNQAAWFLTTDSRVGSLSDDQITADLTITSEPTQAWHLVDWQSIITLRGVANTNSGITPQTGVVIFETDATIDWAAMTKLVMTKRNLADVPNRQFVWTEPTLRLAIPSE